MKSLRLPVSLPGARVTGRVPDLQRRGAGPDSTPASSHLDDAVNRYAPMIYRLAFRNLGNRVDAERVTERVFRDVAPELESTDDHVARRACLLTAACSAIVDVWRNYSSRPTSRADRTMDPIDQNAGLLDRDSSSSVSRILDQLDPVERRVLVLRLIESRSVFETGQALGLSDTDVQHLQSSSVRLATAFEKASREGVDTGVATPGSAENLPHPLPL